MLGSLISVGGSLLGGLFGKSSAAKAQDKQNWYNHPTQVRSRAEEAGFNPLLFIGPGVGQQAAPAASGHMGAAVADASMMLANGLQGREEEKARLEGLRLQNEKLRKELTSATLRPKSQGLYGNAVNGASSAGSMLRAGPVVVPQGISGTGPKDALFAPLLAGEKPEREEMKDEAFLKTVRVAGDSYLVPSEPDIGEFLTNLAVMAPQKARHSIAAWERDMQRHASGKATPDQRRDSTASGLGKSYRSTTLTGILDTAAGWMGMQTRPSTVYTAPRPKGPFKAPKSHTDILRQRENNFNAVMFPKGKK